MKDPQNYKELLDEAERILNNCSKEINSEHTTEELKVIIKLTKQVRETVIGTQLKILTQDWPEEDIQSALLMSLLIMLAELTRLIENYQKKAYGFTDEELMHMLILADQVIVGENESILSKMAKKYAEA